MGCAFRPDRLERTATTGAGDRRIDQKHLGRCNPNGSNNIQIGGFGIVLTRTRQSHRGRGKHPG